MRKSQILATPLKSGRQPRVLVISILVGIYGAYLIGAVLAMTVHQFHHIHDQSKFSIYLSLLIGLSIIYLSTTLRRRKYTAWLVSIVAYSVYLAFGIEQILSHIGYHDFKRFTLMITIRAIILPILLLLLLFENRAEFVVKSDIRGIRSSLRFVVIILIVTLIYGVVGFQLLDDSDFHQEIGVMTGLHYTVDQFNLTTPHPLHPHTKRAHVFLDSLSFVSTISVAYALLSFFQPLKSRFGDQSHNRDRVKDLLDQYGGSSEEFFKMWPHDKQYFFDDMGKSAIAFHVYRGVALCLSDPIGDKGRFDALMGNFLNLCFSNDWLPAFIHVSEEEADLYERCGFTMQKLGQEAIVDINHFTENLKATKYFRQILNKFNKQGYNFELLKPPHHTAVLTRVKDISDDWLSKGSRSERGYAMGYYTDEYMQLCNLAVARDAAGTIQAFTNVIPAEFDKEEATYDLLRQSDEALSNINDYILINLIDELQKEGFSRLNMGLSPLAGLEDDDSDKRTVLDNVLKFAYSNGDKFFSFSGLYRFKSKYEPSWQDKYICYKGGLPGFTRTITSLTRAMSKVVKL
jgi:phosphatidylglycerol lysyltransferase